MSLHGPQEMVKGLKVMNTCATSILEASLSRPNIYFHDDRPRPPAFPV